MNDNAQVKANEIGKYLSGNCTDMEVEALMRWKNENSENHAFYKEMESVWQLTQPSEQLIDVDLDQQWKSVVRSLGQTRRPVAMRRRMYQMVAAAAAIALLALVVIFQNRIYADQVNQPVIVSAMQPEENELVILPDNSKVWLRSGSEISYDSDFSTRDVILKGEGFFEVTSDPEHPFTVRTKEAYVKVLGTRFNLKEMSSGDVELFVEEGRVSFGQEEIPASNVLVTRDQVAVFRINTLTVEGIETEDVNRMSWKTGTLVFENVSLGDVLSDLERHYEIKFEVTDPEMLECELKADFERSNKNEVIETIEFMMGWEIDLENDVYLITGNPCKNSEK